MKRIFIILAALGVLGLTTATTGCGVTGGEDKTQAWTLAPESALPDFVRDAPPQVKQAYRFAIANPDVLSKFPCYCGCGAMGHESNLGCYIKELRTDGTILFDNHAFG